MVLQLSFALLEKARDSIVDVITRFEVRSTLPCIIIPWPP